MTIVRWREAARLSDPEANAIDELLAAKAGFTARRA